MTNIQKVHIKIRELEREVAKKFEETELVTNVKIHGSIYSSENPLHLQYKIRKDEDFSYKEKQLRMLRGRLINIILSNFPQIREIKREYHGKLGIHKEILIINPEAKIIEGVEFIYNLLSCIKKEAENYSQIKIRK